MADWLIGRNKKPQTQTTTRERQYTSRYDLYNQGRNPTEEQFRQQVGISYGKPPGMYGGGTGTEYYSPNATDRSWMEANPDVAAELRKYVTNPLHYSGQIKPALEAIPWPDMPSQDPNAFDPMRNLQDLLAGLQGQLGEGPPSFDIPGGNIEAALAEASLIDMNDIAYQPEPPYGLREDIYSRLKSGAEAGANNNVRQIKDAARLSGAGPSAPWVQSLIQKAEREAAKGSTEGLTAFYDAFVTASLGRRAGALGQNADMSTRVSMYNAGQLNEVAYRNASLDQSAAVNEAGFGLDWERLQEQKLRDAGDLYKFLLTPREAGQTQTQTTSKPETDWFDILVALGNQYGRGSTPVRSGINPMGYDPTQYTELGLG